jgi:hypothetical protein
VPSFELLVGPPVIRGMPADGNLVLDPPLPGLPRVLLRRLKCLFRTPPVSGAWEAVIDTGAPVTVIPHSAWSGAFRWRAGRDYDELAVAGTGTTLRGSLAGVRYSFRLARLRVPVELAGPAPGGPRLRLDGLVCQLADPGGPPYIILGLWGNALDGRAIRVGRRPGSDDLAAQLEF